MGELNIKEQKENKLLNRTELYFSVAFTGPTPSRKEIIALIAEKLGCNPALIAIDTLIQGYGKMHLDGYAKIYGSEQAKAIEQGYKIKRDAGIKEEKKEAKKAPAKKAAEEKKAETSAA